MSKPFEGQAETHKLDDIWNLLNERLKPPGDQEFRVGVSYKEAIDALTGTVNWMYGVLDGLQGRVLWLEKEINRIKNEHT